MTEEILREVAMSEDNEKATSECALTWAHRLDMQRAQKIALNSVMEAKEFDVIQQNTKKHKCETVESDKCKYCVTGLAPQQYLACVKICGEYGKAIHFKVVCRSSQRQQGKPGDLEVG